MRLVRLFVAGAFVFFAVESFGQIGNVSVQPAGNPITVSKYPDIEGTPFLHDGEWRVGSIVWVDKKVDNIPLRYNAYEQEVQYLKNNNPFVFEEGLKSFAYGITDQNNVFVEYLFVKGDGFPKPINKTKWVRMIYSGNNFQLIQQHEVLKTKVAPPSYGAEDITKFVEDSKDFLLVDGKIVEDGRINQRMFTKAFKEKKKEIKDYVNSRDIDTDNYEELLKLARYIDGIL